MLENNCRRYRLGSGIAALIALLSGCSSGPQLAQYPRREIDRPYTLPKGIDDWQPSIGYQYSSDKFGDSDFNGQLDPLNWQQSLSDDWNILWAPIPLGVLHQFTKNESDMMGAAFSLGLVYDSVNGFDIRPTFSFTERHYFTNFFALDVIPSATPRIAFQYGQPFDWVVGFAVEPLFQLTDTLAFQPGISLNVAHGETPQFSFYSSSNVSPANATQVTWPVSASIDWSASRRWDLDAGYTYYGFGYDNGFTSHVGILTAIYYW